MAGKITVSTINDSSGVLATQNGMTGIAKAWVNFNGAGSATIRSSFNVSSVTYNGAGDYTINFTTAMANANYAISGSSGWNDPSGTAALLFWQRSYTTAPTTSACRVGTTYGSSNASLDSAYVSVIINGA